MDDCKEFRAFCREKGNSFIEHMMEELMEYIYAYNESKSDSDFKCDFDVYIINYTRIDAINIEVYGVIEIEGVEYLFVIEDGNRMGTVITQWGEDIKYTEPKRSRIVFIPFRSDLKTSNPMAWKGYQHWKKQDWFKEKQSDYAYDMHFDPCGNKTRAYWNKWLQSKGLIVSHEEVENG